MSLEKEGGGKAFTHLDVSKVHSLIMEMGTFGQLGEMASCDGKPAEQEKDAGNESRKLKIPSFRSHQEAKAL